MVLSRLALRYSVLFVLALFVTFQVLALGAGELDPTFSGGFGYSTLNMGDVSDFANDVIRQPDGKYVVVGSSFNGANDDFAIARFNANGTLDTGFGTSGYTRTDFGGSADVAMGVALQADGKIVVVGHTNLGGDQNFAVARYTTGGVLDTTFDSDGMVVTEISTTLDDGAYDVAIDSAQNIIVGGGVYVSTIDDDAIIVRYNTAGALDASFGTGGISRITTGADWLRSIVIDGAGKIVGMGRFGGLLRIHATGTLDTTFAGDGTLYVNASFSDDYGRSVFLYPGGKYIVIQDTDTCGGCTQYLTAIRVNNDGTFDNTFGSSSVATLNLSSTYNRLDGVSGAVDSSGRVVVVGAARAASGSDYSAVAVRFTPTGALDTTFSGDGWTLFGTGTGEDRFTSVVINPDSSIVAVGHASGNGVDSNFLIAKFLGTEIPAPAAFDLASPAPSSLFTVGALPDPLTFTWQASAGATEYTLSISESGLFGSHVVLKPGILTNSYTLNSIEREQFIAGGYKWTVVAFGTGGQRTANQTFTFDVGTPNLLLNNGFETQAKSNASKAVKWKGVGLSSSDRRICNKPTKVFADSGECAFQFKSGVVKTRTLTQNIVSPPLATDDYLVLNARVRAKKLVSKAVIKVVIKYVSLPKQKINLKINAGSYNYLTLSDGVFLQATPSKISVTISGKSTTGTFYVDSLNLYSIPSNTRSRIESRDLIPVPDAPSGFRR